jgi:predicted transcriptional regulator
MAKRTEPDDRQVLSIRIDDEDKAIVLALAKFERLNMSDVARRAIRHYAKTLGVMPENP